jgi:flagellar M-ring protein FliF
LAQAAVGFDAARGDLLTVEQFSFDANQLQVPQTSLSQMRVAAEGSPVLIKYGVILCGILAIVAFGVRPAVRRITGTTVSMAKEQAKELAANTLQPTVKAFEQAEVDPERLRTQEIFEQVSEHLKKEPSQSSRLLQSWIHQD